MIPLTKIPVEFGALIGAAAGIAAAFLCFLVLRIDFARAKRLHREALAALETEVRSELALCRAECVEQTAQVTAQVSAQVTGGLESLRQSIPQPGAPRAEALRSQRSQVMQLLRSGMSPEAAAKKLDLPAREVLLIAKVSRALSSF